MAIRSVEDMDVYKRAYQLAMEVFWLSRSFPPAERYSLADQLVRSSRSVAANIREGFAKREYDNVFFRHLVDALGSAEETQTWLDFAKDCDYLDAEKHQTIIGEYREICSMLYTLRKNWAKRREKSVRE